MDRESDEVRHERTARRAYEIWEREGRPAQRELAHWLEAEHEVAPGSRATREQPARPVTNLDRALSAPDRTRARAVRPGDRGPPEPPPDGHFVIVADRAGVQIYAEEHPPGQRAPRLRSLQKQHFAEGHEEYFARDTSPQGRFPGNNRHPGMSIDERLSTEREHERRLVGLIAQAIAGFLRQYPHATWDFAAGAPLHRAILDRLDSATRGRLQRLVTKELANQPLEDLPGFFAAAPPP